MNMQYGYIIHFTEPKIARLAPVSFHMNVHVSHYNVL